MTASSRQTRPLNHANEGHDMSAKLTRSLVTAVAGLTLLAGCGGSSSSDSTSPLGESTTQATSKSASDTVTVGSANFPENVLLAEIYAGALEAKGVTVKTKLNIGAREVYIPALQDGSIDLIPEYSGVLLSYFRKGGDVTESSPGDVYAALKKETPAGLSLLNKSSAEDKDTVAVTQQTASKYKLTSIADLQPVAKDLVIGAGPEFRTRYTGLVGLKKVYGVEFKDFKPLDVGGPLTIKALTDGTVDAANVFSTDSNIKTKHFVVLQDPKNLFTAQNVVPLVAKSKASSTVTSALNAVSAKLTTANLTSALKKVQVDKADPKEVAQSFLKANGLV